MVECKRREKSRRGTHECARYTLSWLMGAPAPGFSRLQQHLKSDHGSRSDEASAPQSYVILGL